MVELASDRDDREINTSPMVISKKVKKGTTSFAFLLLAGGAGLLVIIWDMQI